VPAARVVPRRSLALAHARLSGGAAFARACPAAPSRTFGLWVLRTVSQQARALRR
jgi:hypothetical protein